MTLASAALRLERAHRAVDLAEELLRDARARQTPEELAQSRRIARMMEDPQGKELTISLTDQAFRSRRPARIADQLAYLLDRYGTPRFMEWWERAALLLGGVMGQYLPSLVVPPIVARLRHETESLILPGEAGDLERYLSERRAEGVRLNLNQLGEAILGDEEAARRMDAYSALLARPDVEYISVKVSSVESQINLVAFRDTAERVKQRLRVLYRQALSHTYRHPDGRVAPKFVNLDMEEYRDLDLTVTAFREVLDEPEFLPLPAGIVLQAYLPESHRVQRSLVQWAVERRARGGAPIKIRVVKGANLAMERIDAALHDWPQAPYRRSPRSMPTGSAWWSTAAAPTTPAPSTSASPATTSSTSRTVSCCERPRAWRRGSSSRCSRGWPTTRRARCRCAPAASCSMRRWSAVKISTAPSRTSSAGSTRTPPPTTSCATSSASSPARPTGTASATASSLPSR